MTHEDRELLSALRVELAALGRDMAYVQKEIAELRTIFSRLVWLVVAGTAGALVNFVLGGGLNV